MNDSSNWGLSTRQAVVLYMGRASVFVGRIRGFHEVLIAGGGCAKEWEKMKVSKLESCNACQLWWCSRKALASIRN